ncbi:uncharacterized protein [Choristoneura fumiferana]|uniref:uncharacterized protein n=1 Tax=Choristoneura fumiferana TaxID=7141 RepID=UPI003D15D0D9
MASECPEVKEEEEEDEELEEDILWADLFAGDEVKRELMLGPDLNQAEYLELDFDKLPVFHGFGADTSLAESKTGDVATNEFLEEPQLPGLKPHSYVISEEKVPLKPCYVKLERVLQKKKFKCPICEKLLSEKKGLSRHILTHTQEQINTIKIEKKPRGKGKFKCHKCGQRLSRKDGLVRHLKIHAKRDPFVKQVLRKMPEKIVKCFYECDVCGRQSSRKESLARHLAAHEKQPPVCCTVCNEPFKIAWELMEHMKVHDEENLKASDDALGDAAVKSGIKSDDDTDVIDDKLLKIEETVGSSEDDINNDDDEIREGEPVLGPNEETYYCGVCEKQFENMSQLGDHQCKGQRAS